MIKTSHINRTRNADGSQNVSFYRSTEGWWYPAGKVMPSVPSPSWRDGTPARRLVLERMARNQK